MRLKWKFNSVHLEMVLILTQDRCTVCVKRAIGSQIILLGDVGHVESPSFSLETLLVSVQDRCTVCVKRAIGSKIILDTPNRTPR